MLGAGNLSQAFECWCQTLYVRGSEGRLKLPVLMMTKSTPYVMGPSAPLLPLVSSQIARHPASVPVITYKHGCGYVVRII